MASKDKKIPIYSVAEISAELKRVVEGNFGWVRIRGEVSGYTKAASGHLYFSLKDQNAVIDSVCWRGTVSNLNLVPEDGMEIIVSGNLTIYPGRSRYQIIVQALELAGEGALLKLLEERKKKFLNEGLFDQALKKDLPFIPSVIGVVTSPTGAVIKDILHRLSDRLPTNVIIWPALVQGEGAAEQISLAIDGFNKINPEGSINKPDLIIIARGGGSLEDLWAFNEETVVRSAARSNIPIISAIGHETDTTLIDLVADKRAPTPTAAAEMAVPVRSDLLEGLDNYKLRLRSSITRTVESHFTHLSGLVRGLPDARSVLNFSIQLIDDRSAELNRGLRRLVSNSYQETQAIRIRHPKQIIVFKREQLRERIMRGFSRKPSSLIIDINKKFELLGLRMGKSIDFESKARQKNLDKGSRLLESFSYKSVLERGFVVVRDSKFKPISSVKVLDIGKEVRLEFKDGEAGVSIKEKKSGSQGLKKSKRKKSSKRTCDDEQGQLL